MAGNPKPSLGQRLRRAASILISDGANGWFTPNDPFIPQAPPEQVDGRQFQYGVGANLGTTPKSESTALRAVTFHQLRWLAESTEVLRTYIETRKDKICAMDWDWRVIGAPSSESRKDPRVQWLRKFYRKPDGVHTFDSWLRMMQEDLIVLDAPAHHMKRDSQGRILAIEQVDGATIKPLINDLGRVPPAPKAAYMHTLYGMAAIYYSTDDLLYFPRNPRVDTLYGFGPVEQVQVYANMAIRRQMQQLGYFTEGNMPEGMIPVQGTAEQVLKFQKIWDAGEIDRQKIGRIKFVPADSATKFIPFKEPVIASEFDELLARVFAFVMGEEPTPFIKQVNRATAEQANESAQTSGVNVQVRHIKTWLDVQAQDYHGFPDIEAYVVPTKETNPEKVTARVVALTAAGIMSTDEARDEEGLDGPAPAHVPAPAPPKVQEEKPDLPTPVGRLSRADVFNAKRSRVVAQAHEGQIADLSLAWLQRAAQIAADAVVDQMTKVQRAEGEDWAEAIDFEDAKFLCAITPPLETVWQSSANIALGTTGAKVKIGFRDEAAEFARSRGAFLVGKYVDPETGDILPAKREAYRIDDLCRDSMRRTFEQATQGSWTTEKIAQTLQEDHAFSRNRSLAIATTEIVNADEQGKLAGWEASGLNLEKSSLLGSNENHGANDLDNAAQGWIPIQRAFSSGDMAPPYHPHCYCSTVARSVKK